MIKELITLIKRVGGLDELEKQLQIRLQLSEKSSTAGGGKTTTMSPISQSLYEKVISTRRGSTQSRNSAASISAESADTESALLRQNKEHRYSSVVRNSRPRPQNDGLDKLPESDSGAVSRERPQYVTITRTHAPHSTSATGKDDSAEEEEGGQFEESADENESTKAPQLSTHQYVSIRRTRPTSASTTEGVEANQYAQSTRQSLSEAADEQENSKQSTRMPYVSIRRQRPTTETESEEKPTTENR